MCRQYVEEETESSNGYCGTTIELRDKMMGI
jgi:hypothetical protein